MKRDRKFWTNLRGRVSVDWRKKDWYGDRLIWKKAVALWQSRWLWFADRAVFAAFACFFTRHHSETLLSRGAITGTRDEQHAAVVVPRRR